MVGDMALRIRKVLAIPHGDGVVCAQCREVNSRYYYINWSVL